MKNLKKIYFTGDYKFGNIYNPYLFSKKTKKKKIN